MTAEHDGTAIHAYGSIEVRGARENNLKNVSVDVPKRRITVFTGVSGSGKSSLVFDTIAAESTRQLNETFTAFAQSRMPSYGQPDVDSLTNLSASIIVDQKRLMGNARSTVGTITDILALLRLLFSRFGVPSAGYANAYSFNDPEGMCPACQGLGVVDAVDEAALVDRAKSLNQGAITHPSWNVGTWFWNIYALSGRFDLDKPVGEYSDAERFDLLHSTEGSVAVPTQGGDMNSAFEGLVPKFRRLYLAKDVESMKGRAREAFERIVTRAQCPDCGGTRFGPAARASLIDGRSIADHCGLEVVDLIPLVRLITEPAAHTLVNGIAERLGHLVALGLGYLTLARETSTLSGGESQRVKMVRHLGSSLTDMLYVFDEPSIGLHPSDVHSLGELLKTLRDKGNTVLVVEHDPDVIDIADHCVDLGPGAGPGGGQVVYAGDLAGLGEADTATGRHLRDRPKIKRDPRPAAGELRVSHASTHNLKDVSVGFPLGVLTAVSGVAGSGKSTLVHGFVPSAHPDTVLIDQSPIRGSRRSNPATYTGALDPIRKLFAKVNKVPASLFSPNSEGACEACQGLGVIYTDLAFMDPVVSMCEVCWGRRFHQDVLVHTVRDRSIADVLGMSVGEAVDFFAEPSIHAVLARLDDVGLGYLALGQGLNTLSGGERQRLKLAMELGATGQVYVLDEPTTGLHMSDVQHLVGLMNRLVDAGSTVIVIEHHLDVIAQADWVIDLGPGAGRDGGRVVFEGTPAALATAEGSLTGTYLARQAATP